MTHRERILKVLSETAAPLCDDCLARIAGIAPRQTVYQNCTGMAKVGIVQRGRGNCVSCAKTKIVSWADNKEKPDLVFLNSGRNNQTKTLSAQKMKPTNAQPWYWEGNIQAQLVAYLATQGYFIRSVADTASRTQGKDIVAVTPDGCELWVSVKGFPANNSYTQARHYFAQAVFDVILYRSENPAAELALALPDGVPTYRGLASRISWLRRNLPLRIYWVDDLGNVKEE
ncbi:MAG TPA: hypothetical protein GXX19_13025 [Syntrophomonadaceae bacterium]|nr:hypothetical protein [Syntrophomonadaceae bacterium]